MKASDFYKKLGLGDSDMENARKWVSYKTFAEAVPQLTLEEFVSTVYKQVVINNTKPHRWFSERYLSSEYFYSDIEAEDKYITEFAKRILVVQQVINKEHTHIFEFTVLLVTHITMERKVFPKSVLEFLNKVYKTKGDLGNIYTK